jgi:hypothetical protein
MEAVSYLRDVLKLWPALGPLLGVVVGAWLTARWQRKKWIFDNKAAEYRALFDALSSYRFILTEHYGLYEFGGVVVSAQKKYDDEIALAKSQEDLTNAFGDRIFTRQAIKMSGAIGGWTAYAERQLSKNPPSLDERLKLLDAIHRKIVQASQEDLKLEVR